MAYVEPDLDEEPNNSEATKPKEPEAPRTLPTRRKRIPSITAADVAHKEVLTVPEVAALTGFSRDTITRVFENERGVLIIARPTTNRKRRYRSIRIPRTVYQRVVRALSVDENGKHGYRHLSAWRRRW
jgi:hypothetical protein